MSTFADEVAYCTGRIARSTALAEASTDSCARASHVGIARAYGDRLALLGQTSDVSKRANTSTIDARSSAQAQAASLGFAARSR